MTIHIFEEEEKKKEKKTIFLGQCS